MNQNRMAAIVIFVFSVLGIAHTATMPNEAALFPQMVIGAIILLSALMLIRTFKQDQRGKTFPSFFISIPRFLLIISLMLGYIIGVQYAGYYTATLFFIPLTAWMLGFRNKGMIVSTTILYILGIYLVFNRLFELPLPLELFQRLRF
jgi:hypothetical protein